MKKNYDIRLNSKPLSREQIAKHKDFDALLNQYNAKPNQKAVVRKLAWRIAAVAAALVGIFFVSQLATKEDYTEKQTAFFNARQYVSKPFEQIKPSFASFKVNPNEGGIYKYPSGSQLTVPASAFVNEKGETLSGEVTIHYREMHDFVDFFVAGIPMTYDSAGVSYNLESAGMIEIFAEQDGKKVNMAPGKSINVELVSNVNTTPEINIPPGYNIYKLDTEKRSWVYQNVDKMQVISDAPATPSNLSEDSPFYPAQKTLAEKMLAIQVSEAAEIAKLEKTVPKPKEPSKPQRAINNDHVFDLDMDEIFASKNTGPESEEELELRQLYKKYAKMLWQLSPKSDIKPEQLQKEFSLVTSLNIKRLNAQDYELTLEKKGASLKVLVNPVLSGADYERAMADFNSDLDNFNRLNAEREEKLAAQKAAIAQRFEEEKKLATLNFEERVEELRKQGHDYAANSEIIKKKVVNRFTASEFGIWNCDRPIPPQMLQLAANFVDENGKSYKNRAAFLVDKSRNTVYQFLAEDGAELRFNKSTENLLWIMTDDNKIAVFRPEQFKNIDPKAKKYEFVMESVNKEIKSEQDIREILYL